MERDKAKNLFKKAKEGDRNLREGSSVRGEGKGRSERTSEKEVAIFFNGTQDIFVVVVDKN